MASGVVNDVTPVPGLSFLSGVTWVLRRHGTKQARAGTGHWGSWVRGDQQRPPGPLSSCPTLSACSVGFPLSLGFPCDVGGVCDDSLALARAHPAARASHQERARPVLG